MNGELPIGPEHRPDHPALRLDAACDRFEATWRQGRRPRIEDALDELPEPERLELLRALLELERELRRGAGEHPAPDESLGRFPQHTQLIAEVFTTSPPRVPAGQTLRMRSAVDDNLLFGILALQNNFVSRAAVVQAFHAWVADKSRPLAQVLRDRGDLDAAHAALLEALAREHLKLHGGDPQQSLAALSSLGSARDTLLGIADPEVTASLRRTAVGRPADPAAAPRVGAGVASSGVSRFRILRPHARGGLGEVFVAFDDELHREVALKKIRPGRADDPESRTRFMLEAEITGNLEHPGVVPVYGLGSYGDGRPFYAMRFVQGDSLKAAIARFHAADVPGRDPGERALALRGLLGRFLDVCDAIAYAHSRGVLHRDLKPGNIMLGKYGETLVVDWGLAKAVGQAAEGAGSAAEQALRPPSASGTAPTVAGVALGTPGFMSPERAAGELDRLGPRSDVYSLGATLYVLFAGRPPFDESDGDVEVVLGRVRAGEIVLPRRVKPGIPPALEAVCLQAMALRPEARYASARALAEDIEHWLADEPVSAWREPWPLQARRWAKRHRTAVAAAVVALVAGVVGLGAVVGVQARANVRLERANDQTKAALAQSEESRQQAEAVSTFLVAAFRSPDPSQDGRQVQVADLLDRASERLDKEFAGSQTTRGALLDTLGLTYRGLGLYDRAVSLHWKARAVREAALGADHLDTLISRIHLANADAEAGRLTEAIALFEATLELLEAKLGPDHLHTLASRNNLANAYQAAGRWTEAIALHEATLELTATKLGPDHPDTLAGLSNLAAAYYHAGRLSEAIPRFEATTKLREARLGPDHPDTLTSRDNLASAYADAGRLAEAIALHQSTLQRLESKLGPDHPDTLTSRNNLAGAYAEAGRLTEAIALFETTLRLREAKVGPDHPDTLISRNNLALAFAEAGRTAEAIALHEGTLKLYESKLGPDHPDTLTSRYNLASAYDDAGRLAEAIALLEGTVQRMEVKLGPDHPRTLDGRSNLASAYAEAGRLTEAIALFEATLELLEVKLGPDHLHTLSCRGALASAHESLSRWVEAERLRRDVLARRRKIDKPDNPLLADALALLGRNLLEQSRWSEAESLFREALAIREQATPDDWSRYNMVSLLGGALLGQDRYADAEPLVGAGYEGMKRREARMPVPERSRLREAAERILRLYERWNQADQVTAWKAKLGLRDLPAEVFAQP
jgi:serine/threonine-protein kinase